MNKTRRKLSLYPATYQIKVPGKLDESWIDWSGDVTVSTGCDSDEQPVTTLTGTMDQAALQGLLRRLYSLGLPLISVAWIPEEQGPALPPAGAQPAADRYDLEQGE